MIKNAALLIIATLLFFMVADASLTAMGLDPFSKQNKTRAFVTGEKHPIYHHDLKKNLDHEASWGPFNYRLCTNEYGFKISCNDLGKAASKSYDLAFIGDSFTEAVGMDYENSFVGMYAAKHPDVSVVNLGVSSYSPSIYYTKIKYLLDKGFTFKHIVVLPDISDIQDEAKYYQLTKDLTRVEDKIMPAKGQEKAPFPGAPRERADRDKIFWEKYFGFTWFLNLKLYNTFSSADIKMQQFNLVPERAGWTHDQNMPDYGLYGVQGGIDQAVQSMEKLKQLLDTHGIKMSVAVYPWPAQLMHNDRGHPGVTVWKEFCERVSCYSFVDANTPFYDAMEKMPLMDVLNTNYLPGDFHFTPAGNTLVYKSLDEMLKK